MLKQKFEQVRMKYSFRFVLTHFMSLLSFYTPRIIQNNFLGPINDKKYPILNWVSKFSLQKNIFKLENKSWFKVQT